MTWPTKLSRSPPATRRRFHVRDVGFTVNNVAPTLTVDSASVTVDEGQRASNSGTYADVPADTVTLTASIGTIVDKRRHVELVVYGPMTRPRKPSRSRPATRTAARPSDVQLTVNNVAPTVTVDNASVTVNETHTATNGGTYGDVRPTP